MKQWVQKIKSKQKQVKTLWHRANANTESSPEVPMAAKDISPRARVFGFFKILCQRFRDADALNNAKVLVYFTLLSVFPALIVLGNLFSLLHINQSNVLTYVRMAIPADIMKWLMPTINGLLTHSNSGLLSLGAIVTLWSASRGINAMKTSFNHAYGVKLSQNFVIRRLFAMITTLLLLFAIVLMITVFTFGSQFLEFLAPIIGIPGRWISMFKTWRWPVAFVALFIVLAIIYYFLPNVKLKLWTILPGTLFTTIGWLLLAQVFALYVHYFGTRWISYGTIGTFIVLLLWLNFSGLVIIVGAILNAVVYEFYQGKAQESDSKLQSLLHHNEK